MNPGSRTKDFRGSLDYGPDTVRLPVPETDYLLIVLKVPANLDISSAEKVLLPAGTYC